MTKKDPPPAPPPAEPELPVDYLTGLTRPEQNRLLKLIERLNAASASATRCLQYGYKQLFSTAHYNNAADLEYDLGRLQAALKLMTRKGDINNETIMQRMVIELPLTKNSIPREREDDHKLDPRQPL